ncbi:MAG: mobile mystery protein B [Bacteroidetes bacterium]|nr:mobile mystery protein B [Bacteroidota bacterium]
MGLDDFDLDGQTPLEEEEKKGLKIHSVTNRTELNELEQQNIEEALLWLAPRKLNAQTVLSENFIKSLHKRMFGNVWSWAGQFRKTEKNIGIRAWQIPTELKALTDDAIFWVNHETYLPDEIAIRFKHRLVSIHCFSNGNGRHSRLMADIIANKIYNLPEFRWGNSLAEQKDVAKIYLMAIRKADKNDFSDLVKFARS